MKPLRSLLQLALVLALGACDAGSGDGRVASMPAPASAVPFAITAPDSAVAAVHAHAQGADVQGEGVVERVLRDDTNGSAHQKFLLRLSDGTTVLVAHNTDIAPRLDGLVAGDRIAFRGEYLWNPKGGTLHWTHHDPRGRHPDGWLRWRGRTYD